MYTMYVHCSYIHQYMYTYTHACIHTHTPYYTYTNVHCTSKMNNTCDVSTITETSRINTT